MPQLKYSIGYIDLRPEINVIFDSIKTRTEIRRAEKSLITAKVFRGDVPLEIIKDCQAILKELLHREYVPYSPIFDKLLLDKNNYLFVAYQQDKVVSFILVNPQTKNNFFKDHKTAFLELSGTKDEKKSHCPNYLLIWRAIIFLKEQNFTYFNLGLLNYLHSPDQAIENVAFFKRKWNIQEQIMTEESGWGKFFYYRYLKNHLAIKKLVYLIKLLLFKI
jgi:hypothetical protein